MSDFFTIEDGDNISTILIHHLGNPRDEHASLNWERYEALERDLLRYCTRLRCQPNTQAHSYRNGDDIYRVPEHKLIDREVR